MEGVELGPVLLRWNGLLIAMGIACGALLSAVEARRRFEDSEIIYHLFVPVTIWAWIASRLWHVLTPPLSSVQLGMTTAHYLSHPLDILAFWIGGFGIPGALLGGTIALWAFARSEKLPFWELADVLAPGLVLAQAIGRVGNYFNQELYGLPARMPWAIFISPEHRLIGYEAVEFYHPLYAYEALLFLGCAALLLWLSRGGFADRLKPGDLFLIYLSYTSIVRFLLEFLRLDAALVNGINANQAFFGLIFALSAGAFARNRRSKNL
jgi:phosphatidylglycerol:prolipoprotein diacylglycerol transferase